MRIRRVAILIDGGFFLKRIKSWPNVSAKNADAVKREIVRLCRNHIKHLAPAAHGDAWLDHVYRMFFYDADPYEGSPYNPISRKQVNFAKTEEATFRRGLFELLRKQRKFALRLGTLKAERTWSPYDGQMKSMLQLFHHISDLDALLSGQTTTDDIDTDAITKALAPWRDMTAESVYFPLRQKGVDMKIGLDIASMTLKRQVDTIVLVTGDSDFVPAAKVARREGVEFILDPMWQSVDADLMEHIDGIASGFSKPYKLKS